MFCVNGKSSLQPEKMTGELKQNKGWLRCYQCD